MLKPAFSVGQSPIRLWTSLDWHTAVGRVARHFAVKEPITISALLKKEGGHVLRSWLEKTMPQVVIMDLDDTDTESYCLPIVEAIEATESGKGYIQVPWQRATLGAIKRHIIECQIANYFSNAVLPTVSKMAKKIKSQLQGVTLSFSDTEVLPCLFCSLLDLGSITTPGPHAPLSFCRSLTASIVSFQKRARWMAIA